MENFTQIFDRWEWDDVKSRIYSMTRKEVEVSLRKQARRDLTDFMALVSPAAAPYLEEMALLSHQLTRKRFGNTVQMYIPVYLSNECQNICTYCGFSLDNSVKRITLTESQLRKECEILKSQGFDHVLLVTGESHKVALDYFKRAVAIVKDYFANISMEVQPLEEQEYRELREAGVHSILVYQETYHRDDYKKHHPKGKKSNFNFRLETPDRIGRAGMYKIGVGVLIGLEDWRTDSFFTALHLDYLEKKYWQCKYSLSFPRLRPHAGGLTPKVEMTDRELVQLICAYRIFNTELEISLSTRESRKFRDNVISLGVTTVSAGSKTNPGGYSVEQDSLEQFEIDDDRSAAEISEMIKSKGYVPVWKDWDPVLQC